MKDFHCTVTDKQTFVTDKQTFVTDKQTFVPDRQTYFVYHDAGSEKNSPSDLMLYDFIFLSGL